MTIILYDIPSTLPGKIWNPTVLKTRFCLNFKGIPFTTQWVEYVELEPLFKKLGIEPTGKWPDGRPFYSVPSIYDPSTGVYVSDSIKIAEYLEKTYPNTPTLFPGNTAGVQSAFSEGFLSVLAPISGLALPSVLPNLNPISIEYLRGRVEAVRSKDLEQDWIKLQEAMDQINIWFGRNGGKGQFLLGEVISWADIVVASILFFLRRAWGEDSEEWKKICSWNGGRWKNFSDAFKKYETVI
ncbi:Glutathione S-transferase-like protein ustS [Psilocybe cubensis]|uniref:Glutathione S-transferase-like protein ustS n=2 Tax=Psilocybe cubensis TaxID=181762 RepID=A0ACB8GZM1_PSICU|nr:Glutathione S-transferase-like protein ustS [Psilocybe cubensis]KAH9480877.1 Glutathione S-transferase-like protein ustS [Psilocybe cubensis]